MAKIQLMKGDRVIKEVHLGDKTVTIGRDPSNDIHIDNVAVSRFHAELYRQGYTVYVEDLKSTNGTYLNGKFMTWKSGLNHRDRITIGRHVLVFQEEGSDKGNPDDACQTVFMSPEELKKK